MHIGGAVSLTNKSENWKMNIAQQIKSANTKLDNNDREVVNHEAIYAECEEKAITTEQDFDYESTEYVFADGSVLVICNGQYNTYNCK